MFGGLSVTLAGVGRVGRLVGEEFVLCEEAGEFDCGIFLAIGCMHHIHHDVYAEVAANRSWCCFLGIGRSKQIAHALNGVFARKGKGDKWGGLHERLHLGKEGLVGNVRVMLAQESFAGAKHFAAANLKASAFEALNDFADFAAGNAVGLEESECRNHEPGNIPMD